MKIVKIKEINKGALVCQFDLQFPTGLEVTCNVMRTKAGGFFVSYPSREFVGADGQSKRFNLVRWGDRTQNDKASDYIVSELKKSNPELFGAKKEVHEEPFNDDNLPF